MSCSRSQCGIRICSIDTQEFDELILDPALAGHSPADNEAQHVIDGTLFRSGFQDDPRDLNDVGRQTTVTNGILRNKFEQPGVAEVVAALEEKARVNEAGCLL